MVKKLRKSLKVQHRKGTSNRTRLLYALIAIGIIVTLALLGVSKYYVNKADENKTTQHDNAQIVDTETKADKLENVEKTDKPINTDTKKPSEAQISKNITPRGTTTTYGGGCAGAACYAKATFSLIASPSIVTMQAGASNVPITIKTKDGSKVDWGGMPEDGKITQDGDYSGIGTHGNEFPGHSTSFTYYIDATSDASGIYHLTFYARKENPRQQATVLVTVKVVSHEY